MKKFKGFKIGQEFEILDAEHIGVDEKYSNSDKMLVTSVTSHGNALCDNCYGYTPEWVTEGYLKLIKDVPKESPKITPRNLGCFEEVANIIGEESAEEELQKVIDLGLIKDLDVELELLQTFKWSDSPQGDYFWDCIHSGYVPEECTSKGNSYSGTLHSFSVIDELGDIDEPIDEYTGSSVSYYTVKLENDVEVECNDIIEALGMSYAEGNAFKAIWRKCAAQTLGKSKKGYDNGLYDSEKVVFFGERMVVQEKRKLEDQ